MQTGSAGVQGRGASVPIAGFARGCGAAHSACAKRSVQGSCTRDPCAMGGGGGSTYAEVLHGGCPALVRGFRTAGVQTAGANPCNGAAWGWCSGARLLHGAPAPHLRPWGGRGCRRGGVGAPFPWQQPASALHTRVLTCAQACELLACAARGRSRRGHAWPRREEGGGKGRTIGHVSDQGVRGLEHA